MFQSPMDQFVHTLSKGSWVLKHSGVLLTWILLHSTDTFDSGRARFNGSAPPVEYHEHTKNIKFKHFNVSYDECVCRA